MKQRKKVVLNDIDDETKDDEIISLKETVKMYRSHIMNLSSDLKKTDYGFKILLITTFISGMGHLLTAFYFIFYI